MDFVKNASPTVFIVEDDEAVSEALTCLLKSIELPVETFKNPVTFLKNFDATRKGCLVLDVRMPGKSGLDLYEDLKAHNNTLPTIFITGHGDIPMAVRAMKAGAFDFIVKPFNNQVLLEQIQRAINLNLNCRDKQNFKKLLKLLTARESEVLNLIIDGKLNKEISHELSIAISTVELHRSNIMQKLHVRNLADLIRNYLIANAG